MVSESHMTLKPNLGVMKELAMDKYSFYRFGSGGFVMWGLRHWKRGGVMVLKTNGRGRST